MSAAATRREMTAGGRRNAGPNGWATAPVAQPRPTWCSQRAWTVSPRRSVAPSERAGRCGDISTFPDARADHGRLNVGVLTADSLVVTADSVADWARAVGRTVLGHASSSPFVETITATRIDVHLENKPPDELDGGSRPKAKRLRFRVKPSAISVCVPANEEER